jgi:Family of unknown function (DUF6152)
MQRGTGSMRWIVASLLAINVFLMERSSSAHHSFAMFDFTKVVTFRATITEFQWTNPHVILSFVGDTGDGGEPQTWWAELTSPGNLTRVGWSKRAFKAGDRVEITIHPLRDGTHGGAFMKATLVETGQVWTSDLRAQERPELGIGDPGEGGVSGTPPVVNASESKASCSISAGSPGRRGEEAMAALLVGVPVYLGALRRRRIARRRVRREARDAWSE